jgi:outer membrane protein TolC
MKKLNEITILSIFISSVLLAQDSPPPLQKHKKFFDSSEYVLPILINVASRVDPENARQQAIKKIAYNDLRQDKSEILRSFAFISNYSYGSIPTYLNSTTTSSNVVVQSPGASLNAFSESARALYTVGLGFNISFEQLFGGIHNRIDKQKLVIEENNADTVIEKKALRIKIITQYQALLLAKILYDHAEDALQTAYVNKTLVDKQFTNHEAKVTDQMTAQDLYEKAVTDSEQTKSNYRLALLIMEESLGMTVNAFINAYIK